MGFPSTEVCPHCGADGSTTILDTRPMKSFMVGRHITKASGWRRRRRECSKCKVRWNTIELPEEELKDFSRLESTSIRHITWLLREARDRLAKMESILK